MMSTPKPLHDTSADRSTKVMGLALRDVNESLAGSLGIAEGTSEYMNLTSSVSDTVENFIGDGSHSPIGHFEPPCFVVQNSPAAVYEAPPYIFEAQIAQK